MPANHYTAVTEETTTYRDPNDHRIFEQSSENIWTSISACSRRILAQSELDPFSIKGISFDATCSLCVVDRAGDPITVTRGPTLGQPGTRNIILWADHRAETQARKINETGHDILQYVGGAMSVSRRVCLDRQLHVAH